MPSSRRMPKSRRELRERSCTPSATPQPPEVHHHHYPPPACPAPSQHCLYFPYDCGANRPPAYWCSACRVRALSACSQMGLPDVRGLFAYPVPNFLPAGCAAYPHVTAAPRPVACEVFAPVCGAPIPNTCTPHVPAYGACSTAPVTRHDACPTSCVSESGA